MSALSELSVVGAALGSCKALPFPDVGNGDEPREGGPGRVFGNCERQRFQSLLVIFTAPASLGCWLTWDDLRGTCAAASRSVNSAAGASARSARRSL